MGSRVLRVGLVQHACGDDREANLATSDSRELGLVIEGNHALSKVFQISGTPNFVMHDLMLRGSLP